jgi:hypothetical protein
MDDVTDGACFDNKNMHRLKSSGVDTVCGHELWKTFRRRRTTQSNFIL